MPDTPICPIPAGTRDAVADLSRLLADMERLALKARCFAARAAQESERARRFRDGTSNQIVDARYAVDQAYRFVAQDRERVGAARTTLAWRLPPFAVPPTRQG